MTQTSLQRQAPSPATSDKAGASSAQLSDYRVQAREHDAHSSMMQNSARATQFKQMQTLMHQHAAASTASAIPLQKKSSELRKSAKPVLQTKALLTADGDRNPVVQRRTLTDAGWVKELDLQETGERYPLIDVPYSHSNAKIYEDASTVKEFKKRTDAMRELAIRSGEIGYRLPRLTDATEPASATAATSTAATLSKDATEPASATAATSTAATLAKDATEPASATAATSTAATLAKDATEPASATAATSTAATLTKDATEPASATATTSTTAAPAKDAAAEEKTTITESKSPAESKATAIPENSPSISYSKDPNRDMESHALLDPFYHSTTIRLPRNKYIKILVQHTGGHDGYIAKIEEGEKEEKKPNKPTHTGVMATTTGKKGNVSYYSSTHDIKHTGKVSEQAEPDKEGGFDAMTKLVGEGSRFMWVRKHIETIKDDDEYSTTATAGAENGPKLSITFRNLWVTWKDWFNGQYNITDEMLNTVLQNKWTEHVEKKGIQNIKDNDMFALARKKGPGRIKVTGIQAVAPAKK